MNPEDIPLRDLHLPDMIGWWPLAPGWWILLGLLIAFLALAGRRAARHYRENAARRRALSRLRQLESDFGRNRDLVALGVSLSLLLRRTMLAYAPRANVAGLTGTRWLEWLDRGMPDPVFTRGPGRSIESLPYRYPGPEADEIDVDGLIRAVRRRIETPPKVPA